ncbi:hypothetical protein [Halioxenophilus aromaticivorans]|uniref:Uncharacterized protein n=1 Tax=Halioxenophilus aromaticivorans TaxID=1306992 RepID=A0AAV3UA42_9ALTE
MKQATPIIVTVVIVSLLWFAVSANSDKAALQQQLDQLNEQNAALEEQVAMLQQQLQVSEKGTVAGVVEEANNSLQQGLRTMLQAAEQEFNKLQKTLDETLQEWEAQEQNSEEGSATPAEPAPAPENPHTENSGRTLHET